jgi:uncharacterized membrane protein
MPGTYTNASEERIWNALESLDRRLHTIEEHLTLSSLGIMETMAPEPASSVERESLEFTIGKNWLPKIGVMVFTLGVVFLLTLPLTVFPGFIANTLGFVVAGVLLLIARKWRESIAEFARYMTGGAMLLLFFSTLRLHFFTEDPLITNASVVFILLLIMSAINIVLALRSQSAALTSLALILGFAAVLSGSAMWLVLSGSSVMAVIAITISLRKNWGYLLPLGIIGTVLTHGLWAVNNPLFSGNLELVTGTSAHFLFIPLHALIFGIAAWSTIAPGAEKPDQVTGAVLNTVLPILLLVGLSIAMADPYLSVWLVTISAMYIGLAQAFWVRSAGRYITFVYTMSGNLALSMAIVINFAIPSAFVWLCLQSFLVISLAIWFRSRIIVVANYVIFLVILISYLLSTPVIDGMLIVFGIVALLSARIMNWQQKRLELKAEMLRNSYLLTALLVIPYALHYMLPGAWVSLSWAGIAVLYYALSKALNIKKYRWMAMATLLMAVIHIMTFGTTSFEPTYRIISFIVLGIVLLIVSLWYFKNSSRPGSSEADDVVAP